MGDKGGSTAKDSVWAPQGAALSDLYKEGKNWYEGAQPGIEEAAAGQRAYAKDAVDAAMPAWKQQLEGGNLAGYDIAGELARRLGQDQSISVQNVNGTNIDKYGADNPTWEYKLGQQYSGGNSSLDNMMDTMGAARQEATDGMLGSMDARAAASGMSGGSRHGTAIRGGMRDINQNYQDNVSNIGYDAYNKDYDRALTMGQNADQYNNEFSQLNQSNNLEAQIANQGANLEADSTNQGYQQKQQDTLAKLISEQNLNSADALKMQQAIAGYTGGELDALMKSGSGLQLLASMLGNPTSLGDQETVNSASGSIGSISVKR